MTDAAATAAPPAAAAQGAARLRCVARRAEAADIVTFTLRPEAGWTRHATGQCVTVLWDMGGGVTAPRTFTIASPGTRGPEIEITVRRSASGATAAMHDRLRPGGVVDARGPAGGFGPLHDRTTAPLLLVGAGSGATPAMAALRHLHDAGDLGRDVVYLHAAASPDALLFRDELADLCRAMPGLTLLLLPSRVPPGTAWAGPRGRVTRRLLHALVPDAVDRFCYLCGPPGFMDAVRRALRASGVPSAAIREERFHPIEAEPDDGPAPTPVAAGTARLTQSGRAVPLRAGVPLSRSLDAAGVVVPTGCRQGLCGTCRIRVTGGAVEPRDRGGLSEAERAAGLVLACSAFPAGDVEIDL